MTETYTGADLAAFTGSGDLGNIDVGLLIGLDSFTFDNLIDSSIYLGADFDGVAIISYEFMSPVPVPAAAWLFGSALIGLGFLKKRKA